MHMTIELLPGIYLAEIHAGKGDDLAHHFTVFHYHNDLKLADTAEAVLKVVRKQYLPALPERVRTTRIVLVKDSLWEGVQGHLQEIREEGCWIHHVALRHSWLYGMGDYAELAVCFMNLANLPQECETALDGLTADPAEGALVCVMACLEMMRRYAQREGASEVTDEFPAVLDEAIDARLEVMRQKKCSADPGERGRLEARR